MGEEAVDHIVAAQREASDPMCSAWVSAHAGSGKTFVLVRRILRLLLEGVAPERILCLTYTRAAAAVMLNRIFAELRKLAELDNEALERALEQLDGKIPSPERMFRARSLLAHVLDSGGELRVRTLHSFCEGLLRRFALEAGVSPHFRIADSHDPAAFSTQVWREFLNRDCDDDTLYAAVRYLVETEHESGVGEVFDFLVEKRHLLEKWRTQAGGIEKALGSLQERLGGRGGAGGETLLEAFLARREVLAGLREACSQCEASGKKDEEFLKRAAGAFDVLPDLESGRTIDRFWREYRKIFFTQDLKAPRKEIMTQDFRGRYPDLAKQLDEEKTFAVSLWKKERESGLALGTEEVLLRVGMGLSACTARVQSRMGVLGYDDLIHRTQALLECEGALSWVSYKLDASIDHILIDEAQDMSREQWQVVQSLSQDMFSGADGRAVPRSFFAVGDHKQSIYSFQGAAPEAFWEMREAFRHRVEESGRTWRDIQLSMSFRSLPEIMERVDAVCKTLSHSLGGPRHEAYRSGGGVVRLMPLCSAHGDGKRDEEHGRDRQSSYEVLAEAIRERIQGLVRRREQVIDPDTDCPRAIDYGDIVILVRNRNALCKTLMEGLYQSDIPLSGIDRIILSDHIVVKDLMAAAEVALLPDDDLKLATVLKGPLAGLSEEGLFDLAHNRVGTLWNSLQEKCGQEGRWSNDFIEARERIESWRRRALSVRPYEFFQHILVGERGESAFLARGGREVEEILKGFLESVVSYEYMESPNLSDFIHWLGSSQMEIKRDSREGSRAVRVMTVHGAKGLEAPVVILADTCEHPTKKNRTLVEFGDESCGGGPQGGRAGEEGKGYVYVRSSRTDEATPEWMKQALSHKEALDRRENDRLLYVAVTRARDRLYVYGALPGRQDSLPDGSWYKTMREAWSVYSEQADAHDSAACGRGMEMSVDTAVETMAGIEGAEMPEDGLDEAWLWSPAPVPAGIRERGIAGKRREGLPELRGRCIHYLLQHLPNVNDMEGKSRHDLGRRMIEPLLRDHEAMIMEGMRRSQDSQVDGWVQTAIKVMDDPRLAPMFGEVSLPEVTLYVPGQGGAEGSFVRIDRLAVDGETVWLAEYKSDHKPPASLEDVPSHYRRQLEGYMRGVRLLFPTRRLRAFWVWTMNESVMEAPEEWAGEMRIGG